MTTLTAPRETAPPAVGSLSWSSPESRLWVAMLDGEYAGFVEFTEGHYAVSNSVGAHTKTFGTLREAKLSLAPTTPGSSRSAMPTYLTAGLLGGTVTVLMLALGLLVR